MLPQYSDLEAAALRREAGKDSAVYEEKLAWLKQKVPLTGTISDETLEMRLMGSLLYSVNPMPPLDIALITDNLAIFKKHYRFYHALSPTYVNPSELFDQACFCGSQAVAEFLLVEELKLTYLTCGYEHVLKYVAGSRNSKWAKELVQHLESAGKKIPDDFAAFRIQQGTPGNSANTLAPITITPF